MEAHNREVPWMRPGQTVPTRWQMYGVEPGRMRTMRPDTLRKIAADPTLDNQTRADARAELTGRGSS